MTDHFDNELYDTRNVDAMAKEHEVPAMFRDMLHQIDAIAKATPDRDETWETIAEMLEDSFQLGVESKN